MGSLTDQILQLISKSPGMTDREITSQLRGASAPQQPVNQTARGLESKGVVVRQRRADGLIGNYKGNAERHEAPTGRSQQKNHELEALSEDEIKEMLNQWLQHAGWSTQVAWGSVQGIDIDANRGSERWIIEVKGPGSRSPMRVNYFLGILGETLQRMDDPNASYSIALPDLKQYRGLWHRLPDLAKSRTTLSLLLVALDGSIEWLE